MKWKGGKGGRIVRSRGRSDGNVMRWQYGKGGGSSAEKVGWNLRTKLCCIAPGKRSVSRDYLQGFQNSYIMFWII